MKKTLQKKSGHGRPPADEGQDRREKMLDTSLHLFAAHGIAGTTLGEIAKGSEVTSAMVHYYFGSREGLLDAIVAERLAPAMEYIWTGIYAEEVLSDPRKVVTVFVDRLIETVEKMPELPFLWSREILNASGLLRERVLPLAPVERFASMIQAFAKSQGEGKINPRISPALVLTSVLALVMLPLAAQDLLNRIPAMPVIDYNTLKQHVISLILDGLCLEKEKEEES